MSNIRRMLKEMGSSNVKATIPIPIWLLNDKLEKDVLTSQIQKMAEQGVTRFAVKAEHGVIPDYLSADFKAMLWHILAQAKKRNMTVVFADDLQYAHPGVHSELTAALPDFRLQYLSLAEVIKTKGPKKIQHTFADDDIVYIFAMKLKEKLLDFTSAKNITLQLKGRELQWNMPAGDWRIFVFRTVHNKKPIGGYAINCFDIEITRAYIDAAFMDLRRTQPKEVAGVLNGLLIELPNVAPDTGIRGIPWAESVVKNLKSLCNTDLMTLVLALFVDNYSRKNGEIRRTYYKTLLRLLTNNFIKPVQDFGVKNKLETFFLLNAGDLFSGETLLRFDYTPVLTKCALDGIAGSASFASENYASARLFADLKRFYGNGHAVTVLGRNRNGIGHSLKELKYESDQLSLAGLSARFIDGNYYSLRFKSGLRAPQNSFTESGDFGHYGEFLTYLRRKHQVLEPQVLTDEIAVLFPGESFYGCYNPANLTTYRQRCTHFDALVKQMAADNIRFSFLTEELMNQLVLNPKGEAVLKIGAKIKGVYRMLIIPETTALPKKFIGFLEKFVRKGGKVLFFGIMPYETLEGERDPKLLKNLERLQAQMPGGIIKLTKIEELETLRTLCQPSMDRPVELFSDSEIEKRITCRTWSEKKCRYYLLLNTSLTDSARVEVKVNDKGHLYYLDLNKAALYSLSGSDNSGAVKPFIYNFAPEEAALLVLSDVKIPAPFTNALPVEDSSRIYRIILKDEWEYQPLDLNAQPLTSWSMKINSNREVNSGFNVFYESYLNVDYVPAKSFFFLNQVLNQSINGQDSGVYPVEVSFNGVTLKPMQYFGRGERPFVENEMLKPMVYGGLRGFGADVSAYVKRGFNRITLKTYGACFAPLMLQYPAVFLGDFEMKRGNKGWLVTQKAETLKYGSWTGQGYPFYAGRMMYHQIFEKPDHFKRAFLRFKNFETSMNIRVNGTAISVLPWQPAVADITKCVQNEKNKIEIEIAGSANNLLKMGNLSAGLTAEVFLDVYQ
ncbi:MAG: hypothetical protein V1913_16765 [Fibrobacterota bacterium]